MAVDSTTGHRQSMTWWSRHDPVMMPVGNDHWSIMKTRAEQMATGGGGTTRQRTKSFSGIQPSLSRERSMTSGPGSAVFDRVTTYDLHGNIPGNYIAYRQHSAPKPAVNKNQFNIRAKQNYKFWYEERPKPTSFGRYGIGSYKTVLGLGNGPRT